MLFLRRRMGAIALSLALLLPSVAFTQSAVGLQAAIAAGDTAAINAIITANLNDPEALSSIARALLAAAEADRASNPLLSGLLAAEALNTGALDGKAAQRALNIVGSNPTALALLTNPNAPYTAGNSVDNNYNLGPGKPLGLGNTVNQSQILIGSAN